MSLIEIGFWYQNFHQIQKQAYALTHKLGNLIVHYITVTLLNVSNHNTFSSQIIQLLIVILIHVDSCIDNPSNFHKVFGCQL